MSDIRVVSEDKDGVRTVTDSTTTWKEFPALHDGVWGWIKNNVLYNPTTWYEKVLAFVAEYIILFPLVVPVYQLTFVYFAGPWIGLGGWAWWQILLKLVLFLVLWAVGLVLAFNVSMSSMGEDCPDGSYD